jgi:S1-C subfamily serine protease
MKLPKNKRQILFYPIILILGIIFCFGGLPIPRSQAQAIAPAESVEVAVTPAAIGKDSFVAAAVERTGKAVVRIDTETVVTNRLDPLFEDPFFREFFGGGMRGIPPQQERRVSGQGSGFIVDSQGVILTNAHVVNKADKVTVTLKDGRIFNGVVRGTDEVTDLAVVKIDPKGEKLPIAPLGNSTQVRVGDWAIAVGNPIGLDNTVTLGIISTIGRSAAKVGIPDKRIDFLQTDAAINPGNSGGPLLNADGEVIGINTAIRPDAMGIGFAIPINKAKELESALAAGKTVPHPYIGVRMIALTPELARSNNQNPNSPYILPETNGILIVQVMPNTPAQAAGLRQGDVIVTANGKTLKDGSELQSLVDQVGLNQTVNLKVLRGDRSLDLQVRTAQLSSQS